LDPRPPSPSRDWRLSIGLAVLATASVYLVARVWGDMTAAVVATGPVVWTVTWWWLWWKPAHYRFAWVLAGGLAVAAAGVVTVHVLTYDGLVAAAAAVGWRYRRLMDEQDPLLGKSLRNHRQEHEWRRRRRRAAAWHQHAHSDRKTAGAARRASLGLGGSYGPVLGHYEAGDLGWRRGRAIVMPWGATKVVVTMGVPGSGKSELVIRILEWAMAQKEPPQICYLTWKEAVPGEPAAPLPRLAAVAATNGLSVVELTRYRNPFDSFRGSDDEVRERLLGLEVFTEPYYQHIARGLTAVVLAARRAGAAPISTIAQLAEAMTAEGLERIADMGPAYRDVVTSFHAPEARGAWVRFFSQAVALAGWVPGPATGPGWSFEDADVVLIEVPVTSQVGAAGMLSGFLLSDVNSYVFGPRRQRDWSGLPRPMVLVVEEVGTIVRNPIAMEWLVNCVERMRAAGVKVFIVAQTVESLGDPVTRQRLIDMGVVISGQQSGSAEAVAKLAGTRRQREATVAHVRGRHLDAGTVGMAHQMAVNPDKLRRLEPGRMVAFQGGRWAMFSALLPPSAYRVPGPARGPALAQGTEIRAIGEAPPAGPATKRTDEAPPESSEEEAPGREG
jgi:hypothetical protein